MPRRTSAAAPSRLPSGSGLHASLTLVTAPVRATGRLPARGGGGAPVAVLKPTARSSGERVKAGWVTEVLSNEAVPMAFSPTPGAPAAHTPEVPLLPMEQTTTTPSSTS